MFMAPSAAEPAGRGEPENQLGGLDRNVELRGVADSVKHDPVGVREPVAPVAGGGGRPRQQSVFGSPRDPNRTGDSLGVETPAGLQHGVDRRPGGRAAGDADELMREQRGRDVLVVDRLEHRGAAPSLRAGDECVGARSECHGLGLERALNAEQLPVGVVATRPSARRRERDDRAGSAAGGQLERDEAAERIANEVRGLDVRLVKRALDELGERRRRDGVWKRRSAGVPGEGERKHVVPALERRQDEFPHAPRVQKSVQAHERRAVSRAVEG